VLTEFGLTKPKFRVGLPFVDLKCQAISSITLSMTMPFLRSGLRFGCNERAGARQKANVCEQNRWRWGVLLQIFGVEPIGDRS
jgi:hypothetical protein